jgi:hypothetical protein
MSLNREFLIWKERGRVLERERGVGRGERERERGVGVSEREREGWADEKVSRQAYLRFS